MNTNTMPNPIPRLMDEVNLAQPLEAFKNHVFAWASGCGLPITEKIHLYQLANQYAITGSQQSDISGIDVGIALDVMDGLEKAPRFNERYQAFWSYKMQEAQQARKSRFEVIIQIQQFFGGILLDSIETPHALIIPQESGRYIFITHENFYVLSESPLMNKSFDVIREATVLERFHFPM